MLVRHGLKATIQRIVIMQCLLSRHDHPTAEIIAEEIRKEQPSISLATVYKTLDSLVQAGLARKVKTGDDKFHFDPKLDNHSHIYCSNTNQIFDLEDEELHTLLADFFERRKIANFKLHDFQVQINGEIISPEKQVFLAK